jgi:hypothetical protein
LVVRDLEWQASINATIGNLKSVQRYQLGTITFPARSQ